MKRVPRPRKASRISEKQGGTVSSRAFRELWERYSTASSTGRRDDKASKEAERRRNKKKRELCGSELTLSLGLKRGIR